MIYRGVEGRDIVSVSLEPLDFGRNIVLTGKRGYLTMFKQILTGLEATKDEVVFLCEHDVLYTGCHFEFLPPDPDKIYYNQNLWQVRTSDGHCVYWDSKRVSQVCAYREVLIEHYRRRVELVEKNGFSMKMGFEPASHNRKERVDDLKSEIWVSKIPNIDLKHGLNVTKAKWSPADFRNKNTCQNWQEGDSVPGWGKIEGRFDEFLRDTLYDKI